MNTTARRGVVAVLLVVAAACESSRPTSPTGPSQPPVLPPSPTPPPPREFPPLTGPSLTFIFERELSYPVSQYTKQSHFVIFDNGAFLLQYLNLGGDGYHGGYTEANGVITFDFGGFSGGATNGDATGTLKGNSLTVDYNGLMEISDFEDAVYVLTR